MLGFDTGKGDRLHKHEDKNANKTIFISVNMVEPDPDNPRKHFDHTKLHELANSIRTDGLMQPIGVRAHPDPAKRAQGVYMIIFGERRWRAHQLAGLTEIRAEIKPDLPDQSIRIQQYKENADRDNLNAVEEAEFLEKLLVDFANDGEPKPQERMAARLGMPASTLSRKLSVLRYSVPVRQLVRDGIITQVNALAKLNKLSPAEQDALNGHARHVVASGNKFDVANFLKDPQKYLKSIKGESEADSTLSHAETRAAKPPASYKATWRLGRHELVKLAHAVGRADLVGFLQDSPDAELSGLADELREAIFSVEETELA